MENWEVIHTYTRAEAIADGVLIDVTPAAAEQGFAIPVAMTCGARAAVVDGADDVEAARRVESFLGHAMAVILANLGRGKTDRLSFDYRRGDDVCGDFYMVVSPGDTPAPVVTIMLDGED